MILMILSPVAQLVHHCTQKSLYFPAIKEELMDLQSWLQAAAAESQLGDAAKTLINFSYTRCLLRES